MDAGLSDDLVDGGFGRLVRGRDPQQHVASRPLPAGGDRVAEELGSGRHPLTERVLVISLHDVGGVGAIVVAHLLQPATRETDGDMTVDAVVAGAGPSSRVGRDPALLEEAAEQAASPARLVEPQEVEGRAGQVRAGRTQHVGLDLLQRGRSHWSNASSSSRSRPADAAKMSATVVIG